ncbi:SAM-dependent methyltransferase [Lactobacillus corticis]|uniref:SAM-dependent methyltransferase n=1 Tax=Lactobacillus corticis TaxID=2201249 RepID=A0A916QGR8_9LACO|nr:SAM-dependent methyltransferase [Lactobacillus corticis]GFZ27041.1 SAM-dependent methyltransferase [Lactobacillus corticis]
MTKYIEKLRTLATKLQNPLINQQAAEIIKIDQIVGQKAILPNPPAHLGFSKSTLQTLKTGNSAKEIGAVNGLINSFRQYLSINYGIWSLPNLAASQAIKNHYQVKTALEVMAGNAYWSKALSQTGIDCTATDSLEWAKSSQTGSDRFYPVENLSATEAVEKYRQVDLILASWSPNFGDADIQLVQAWRKFAPNAKLLFVGEYAGATNSPNFWQEVPLVSADEMWDINANFISFDFIDEEIFQVKA